MGKTNEPLKVLLRQSQSAFSLKAMPIKLHDSPKRNVCYIIKSIFIRSISVFFATACRLPCKLDKNQVLRTLIFVLLYLRSDHKVIERGGGGGVNKGGGVNIEIFVPNTFLLKSVVFKFISKEIRRTRMYTNMLLASH